MHGLLPTLSLVTFLQAPHTCQNFNGNTSVVKDGVVKNWQIIS